MFIGGQPATIASISGAIKSGPVTPGLTAWVSLFDLKRIDPLVYRVVDVCEGLPQDGRRYFYPIDTLPPWQRALIEQDILEGIFSVSSYDPRFVAVRCDWQHGIDPAWFGGIYNSEKVDNAPALKAAIEFGPVRLRAGYLYCKSRIELLNTTCRIIGMGMTDSEIRFEENVQVALTGNNTYIPWRDTRYGKPMWNLSLQDLSITTKADSAISNAQAIDWTWSNGFTAYRFLPFGGMTRVNIRGVNTETTGWKNGVRLHGVLNYQLYECYFNGKDEGGAKVQNVAAKTRSDVAFYADGGWTPCEVKKFGCHFHHWKKPIEISGSFEGLYMTQCTLVQVLDGVVWNATVYADNYPGITGGGGSAKGRPYFTMSGTHINAYRHGVVMDGVVQGSIVGCALYQNNDAVENGDLVNIKNGHDWMILGNTARNYATNPAIKTNAFVIGPNAGYTTIIGNNVETGGSGIWYQAGGTGHNIELNNTFKGSYSLGNIVNG